MQTYIGFENSPGEPDNYKIALILSSDAIFHKGVLLI